MDIFGIGPLEFVLILIIMLIILGPNDMVKAGRSIGTFLRKLILSDEWRIVQQAGKEFRNLPDRLVREAGIDELKKDLPSMDEIRKELPSMDELTAQSGIPELEKSLQKDFSETIGAAKQTTSAAAAQLLSGQATQAGSAPVSPTVGSQPMVQPDQPAAPAKSPEAFMQKPAQTTPEPAAQTPAPQPAPASVPEIEADLDEEIEASPWVNSPTIKTPTEPLTAKNQDPAQPSESNSEPDPS